MVDDPRFLKATALHVQGLREAKRVAQDAENPEAAAFVGYMFGLELGMTLARADLEWVKAAHDELTTFNVAVDHDDRRIRRRRSLLTEANAIIRATRE
jgi:hypothetical protein